MKPTTFAIRGAVCFSTAPEKLTCFENAFVICQNGRTVGVFPQLPAQFDGIPVRDVGEQLVIPGMNDLHLHAPQYAFHGMYMDLELLEWLNQVTFPEEARYRDLSYARKAYSIFAEDLQKSSTTRACIFATLHVEATELLMDLMENTGLRTYIGKVNMDRNGTAELQEESAAVSTKDTIRWINDTAEKYENVKPILTPRFTPSCTDALMHALAELQRTYGLSVQSHLSENQSEIAWVHELCPNTSFYGEAYDQFGLFGGTNCPTIMAHCVYSSDAEISLMKKRGVFIAHCPQSNTNLSSGIAPARRYLDEGLRIGLGTDIAGGHSLSMLRAIANAIQVSKLRWRLVDDSLKPLSLEEAFYMATMGGGAFFGNVGTFMENYEFDALILDDSILRHPQPLTARERLERLIYLSDDRSITGKYVSGNKIF